MSHYDARRNVLTVRHAATKVGAILPPEVFEALDAEPSLPALGEAKAAAALAVAEAATLPARERDRKIKAALDDLARAEAASAIRSRVTEILDLNRWDAMVAAEDEMREAFAEALKDDVETLNGYAPKVADLDPSRAGDLDPARFEALFKVRSAAARVDDAARAMNTIRPVRIGRLAPADAMRAHVLRLPEGADRKTLRRITLGLTENVPLGGNSLGSRTVLWAGYAAMHGATFEVLPAAEVRAGADRLSESLLVTEEEKARLDSPTDF
jgi:hypothetical protein